MWAHDQPAKARLLFGLLVDLSTARNASRVSGRLAVENVAAGAMMAPGEVRAILDRLDGEIAKDQRRARCQGRPFTWTRGTRPASSPSSAR